MSTVIVIDDTVIEQLNRGNTAIADQMKQQFKSRGEVWMTKENYDLVARIPANAQLLSELGIRAPDKDPVTHPAGRQVYNSYKNEATAALATAKKASLMTADAAFSNMYRAQGGATVTANTSNARGNLDYTRARQLVGLPPISFAPNGQLLPRTPGYTKTNSSKQPLVRSQPTVVIKDGNKTTPVVSVNRPNPVGRTGSPVKPVVEHRLNPSPKTDGVKLGLKGFNWVIQGINDHIQQGRIEERMQQLRPTIEETLKREPTLGVLIVIFFARREKMGAENESPLEHTPNFQYIKYEYGITKEEARKKMANGPAQMRAGFTGKLESQEQWIPPQVAPAARDLPTPFDKSALATFYSGLEELVSVKFSIATGFDDNMRSRIKLDAAKERARFFVMFPPPKIAYFDAGTWRSKDVELALERPRQVWHAELTDYYVPVIELDSVINPWDATAAMVYPADDYTMGLFKPKGRLDDGGLLRNYQLDLIRFVKPTKMSVIENFNAINLKL